MRRVILGFVAACSLASLAIFFVDATWVAWVFTGVVAAFPIALIALAVVRNGRLGPLAIPLLVLLLILEAAFAAMLALAGKVETAPWFGGLPAAAAILIYGVFLAPFLLVVLAYAMTFDRFALRDADLEALRSDFGPRTRGDG